MKLLLDTHIALWTAVQRELLTSAEVAVIADPANTLVVSAVSLWELRLKWHSFYQSGERKGPADPVDVHEALMLQGMTFIDLTPADTVAPLEHPLDHKDPFDTLLLVQAQQGGWRLLTRDARMAAHPFALIAA